MSNNDKQLHCMYIKKQAQPFFPFPHCNHQHNYIPYTLPTRHTMTDKTTTSFSNMESILTSKAQKEKKFTKLGWREC